jgi:hypothetical protein
VKNTILGEIQLVEYENDTKMEKETIYWIEKRNYVYWDLWGIIQVLCH